MDQIYLVNRTDTRKRVKRQGTYAISPMKHLHTWTLRARFLHKEKIKPSSTAPAGGDSDIKVTTVERQTRTVRTKMRDGMRTSPLGP